METPLLGQIWCLDFKFGVGPQTGINLSGTGDSQRDSRELIRANFYFLAHQADSQIRANRANRFARITPLRYKPCLCAVGGVFPKQKPCRLCAEVLE